MTVAVKICCIADVAEARLAFDAGAAALGLVSAMPSGPGVISDERVAEVAAAMQAMRGQPVRTFLLTARTEAEAIAEQHRRCGTTTIQLVDHVPLPELRRLRELCPGVELVQVIHVSGEESLAEALTVAPHVDALLLDSGNPKLAVKELGGTGRTHDWETSRRIRDAIHPLPLWLAGGLHAGNVAEAITRVRPHGLDLCSSVRTEGRLDAGKLAGFMTAVASAPTIDPSVAPAIAPAPHVATAAACPNCFSPLPDPRPRFCGACGQETNVRPPKLGEFLQQFGGAYFSTEGALWRTLVLLLLKPGELTRRYLAGRRKHYVLPLRLYITVSLTALLLMRLGTPTAIQLGGPAGVEVGKVSEVAISHEGAFTVLDFGDGRRAGMENGRFYCEKLPSWICSPLQSRLDLDAKSFARELKLWPERFLSRWGTAMFLLVPIFALLHKLVYFSRRMRYTEHLVYALHMHSFWFLALALSLLPEPATAVAFAAMPIYGVLAAQRVYGGGWIGTLARTFLVAAIYGIVLGLALGVVTAWAFFFS